MLNRTPLESLHSSTVRLTYTLLLLLVLIVHQGLIDNVLMPIVLDSVSTIGNGT